MKQYTLRFPDLTTAQSILMTVSMELPLIQYPSIRNETQPDPDAVDAWIQNADTNYYSVYRGDSIPDPLASYVVNIPNPPITIAGDLPVDDTIETIQQRVWEAIKKERDDRIYNGGFFADNYWFHSDSISRIQQLGLVALGQTMPTGILWKTMSGDFVEMTPLLALHIFEAAVATDTYNFKNAEIHKATMLTVSDPTIYDFSAGWKQTYEETFSEI